MLIYEDYQKERDGNSWTSKLFGDVEDKRAVLMGNGSTLKTVLVLNMITAGLFFMQGFYMFTVVGTTKKTVETIESRPIEECA
jgi:ribonucleotide reductase beta subunit family protein with ferritin-like domain